MLTGHSFSVMMQFLNFSCMTLVFRNNNVHWWKKVFVEIYFSMCLRSHLFWHFCCCFIWDFWWENVWTFFGYVYLFYIHSSLSKTVHNICYFFSFIAMTLFRLFISFNFWKSTKNGCMINRFSFRLHRNFLISISSCHRNSDSFL